MAMEPNNLETDLERLHASSFGWALACCRFNRADAEEALQAAYLKAFEGKARFNGHASVKTWFFGVVKRTAAEQRRGRLARDLGLARWLTRGSHPAPSPSPETLSRDAQALESLRRSILRLSSRQRELLQLVFYHELTVEEAADVLHMRVGTARTHYERGKARLRSLLAESGGR
jgi:RNA polymerase sigma-70 factor (ECF subfamily)